MSVIKYIKSLIICFIGFAINGSLVSCSNDEPNDSPFVDSNFETTILVYAVATNSLSGNLTPDKNEMLLGAENIDMTKNRVLIYQTTYKNNPQLLQLSQGEDGYYFENVKEYDGEVSALAPERISEVLNYVLTSYKSDKYGLIFWSHSSGSQPFMEAIEVANLPATASFGQDLSTDDPATKSINIDVLAKLIPDNTFEFIWFDSCYMSNIESIYEFRGKCNYYIGYATEVMDLGMPYHLVLPCITGAKPNTVKGAEEFFTYYNEYPSSNLRIATVAVIDMNHIENLAEVSKSAYQTGIQVSPYSFSCYTRGTTGPFFELRDYVTAMIPEEEREEFSQNWEKALNKCVIYKAATPRDFNGNYINQERYSGLSCHVYNPDDDSLKERYYKSLAWYKTMME